MKVDYRDNSVIKREANKDPKVLVVSITLQQMINDICLYLDIDLKKFEGKGLTKGQINSFVLDVILGKVSKRYRKEMKQYHKELRDVQAGLEFAYVPGAKSLAKECIMNEVRRKSK